MRSRLALAALGLLTQDDALTDAALSALDSHNPDHTHDVTLLNVARAVFKVGIIETICLVGQFAFYIIYGC